MNFFQKFVICFLLTIRHRGGSIGDEEFINEIHSGEESKTMSEKVKRPDGLDGWIQRNIRGWLGMNYDGVLARWVQNLEASNAELERQLAERTRERDAALQLVRDGCEYQAKVEGERDAAQESVSGLRENLSSLAVKAMGDEAERAGDAQMYHGIVQYLDRLCVERDCLRAKKGT